MANIDAMVQEGVAAIKAGRKSDARKILEKAVELDEHNEQAWLWLSACVESLQEQQICLENVLAISPGNTKAQKGLDAILKQLGSATGSPPAPFGGDFDPFSVTDPYSDPTAAWGDKFDVSPATSVDWGRGTAPTPGSGKEVRTPSPEDLDNWMANLPISKSKPEMPTAPAFDTSFDPLTGPFGVSDNSFDSGKNVFSASSADPFGKSDAGPSPFDSPPTKSADPFDFGDSNLPAGFGAFDNFGAQNANPTIGSNASRNDPFGTSTDFGSGSGKDGAFGGSNAASSADRFKFGGSGSQPAKELPRSDPFSLPKAEPITGRRKASELPGSSSLFRDKDDQDVPDDMDDLAQQAGIFGGGSNSSALKSAKSTLGISSSDPAFRGIPAEIQVTGGSGGGSTRTLLILGVLNVISVIALLLNLRG